MKKEKTEQMNPMKELRQRLGMTQEEFKEKTGITKTTISNIESGKHQISKRTQEDIAEACHLYDDWYTGPNYDEKINIDETKNDILKYIMSNFDNENVARTVLVNLKAVIDTEGLTKEERKTYIKYMYKIIQDMAIVATEAKKHIRKEEAEEIIVSAHKVFNDIMKSPVYDVNKKSKFKMKGEYLFDVEEVKIDFTF